MSSKLNTTCRICLSEDQSGVSIFENPEETKYSDLIHEYTGLNMIDHEILPSIICDDCKTELNLVVKFIDKCRQSNKKLQDLIFYNVPIFYIQRNIKDENPIAQIKKISQNIIKEEFDNDGVDHSESFIDQESSDDETTCGKSNIMKLEPTKLRYRSKSCKKLRNKYGKNNFKVEKEKPICSECGKLSHNKWALEIHMRKHTGERPFSCSKCTKTFTQKGTLTEHERRFHTDQQTETERKKFACDLCDKRFLKKSILMVHMRVHTKEKPFKCTYCDSRFTQLGILSQHEKIHTGEKPHACHLCAKRFITGSCLKRHLRTHEVDRCFKCHICDKTLKTKLAIQEHIMSKHTLEKPFVCDKCGAGFMRKTCLKLHVKAKHSELFGYCNQCNRGYSNLPRHLRVHNGERPYECEICRQTFTIKQRLSVHLALHRNFSKFVCPHDKCAAAYSSQCKLDSHIVKFHSKNFAHICDFCSKGFSRSADLTKHLNFCKKQNLPSIK